MPVLSLNIFYKAFFVKRLTGAEARRLNGLNTCESKWQQRQKLGERAPSMAD